MLGKKRLPPSCGQQPDDRADLVTTSAAAMLIDKFRNVKKRAETNLGIESDAISQLCGVVGQRLVPSKTLQICIEETAVGVHGFSAGDGRRGDRRSF